MNRLRFYNKELETKYQHAVHRGVTRWAHLADHEDEHANRYNVYLCGVLMSDFQTPDACARMLREIECLQCGELKTANWSGNAWSMVFSCDGVQINHHTIPEWDEDPEGWFDLAELKAALNGWEQFLKMPASLSSKVEIELPAKELPR